MPRIFSPENWMENSEKFSKNFRFKSCVRKPSAFHLAQKQRFLKNSRSSLPVGSDCGLACRQCVIGKSLPKRIRSEKPPPRNAETVALSAIAVSANTFG